MLKRLCTLAFLFVLSSPSFAQMYWPVTHPSGTQSVGSFPVTVSRVGLDTMWQLFGSMACPNIGPYQISAQNGTLPECGYKFSFVNAVDSIRIRIHQLHVNEMIRIDINGAPYNLMPANISTISTCLSAAPGSAGIVNGKITCVSNTTTDYADVEINIQTTYNIDSVKILDNSTTNAALVYFAFVNNSCVQDLNAQANTPCNGNALFLNSMSIPGGVYTWTGPGSYTASTQGPTRPNVNAAAAGNYIVTASFGNGCIATDTVNVTVKPIPPTPVATSNSPVCLGGTLNLSASNSTPGSVYVWSGPNSFSSAQQNTSLSPVTTAAAGTYFIVAVANSCISLPGATNVVINTNTIAPNVTISASPGTVITAGTTVSFTATTNLGTGAAFQWRKNALPIAGATSATWSSNTLVNGDVIDVVVSNGEPCVQPKADTSNGLSITIQSGISTVSGLNALALYPNPNNGDLTLSGNIMSGPVQLDIYDAVGRTVLRDAFSVTGAAMNRRLHIPAASPGVYFLRFVSVAGSETLVFTVQ